MHHMYFNGTPVEHMALGAVFSAAEVVPLTFLTVEAWSFLQLGAVQVGRAAAFPHRWAVMFLAAVGFWNFLGAGSSASCQPPHRLLLRDRHGARQPRPHRVHGRLGMLAIGIALFCLLHPQGPLVRKAAKFSFWSLNIGLAWMSFATLFPLGVLQLYHSVKAGYVEARSLEFSPQA